MDVGLCPICPPFVWVWVTDHWRNFLLFFDEWPEHANVIPVFKGKGSKFDVSNYRPIRLTSNIC